MSSTHYGRALLSRWGNWSLKHPILVLVSVALLIYLAMQYTAENLSIDTDTAELVAPDAPFQKNRRVFEKQFSQDVNTLLVVIESDTPELTRSATRRLGRLLSADKENFNGVYVPEDSEFLRNNGLLFLETDELQKLTENLSNAQPFIGRISQQPDLNGFFSLFEDALTTNDKAQELPVDLSLLINKISTALHKTMNGDPALLSWEKLISDNNLSQKNGFIIVRPKFDYAQVRPAENAITAIRKGIEHIQQPGLPAVKVWITGEVGLEDDELAGMSSGTFTASLFSVVVVLFILLLAYRSFWLMLATLVTLALGMVLCGAFAAFAVKQLNLISVAFAVSNIGLGVEYAIHFCLRYRDYLSLHSHRDNAIRSALMATSPSLLLCASTTAIGLYAFIPTDYKGVSELGLLAGTSLFICLLVTLTILPVLLKIIPIPVVDLKTTLTQAKLPGFPKKLAKLTLHHARTIFIATCLLTIVSAVLVTKVQSDFNPLNLRDPNTESVIAFKNLVKDKDTSPMTLTVLSQDEAKTKLLAQKLSTLDSVDKTMTLFDFLPADQEDKLAMLEEMNLVLGVQLKSFPQLKLDSDPLPGINSLLNTIDKVLPQKTDAKEIASLNNLKGELQDVLLELEERQQPDRQHFIETIQSTLLGTLPGVMNQVLTGMNAQEVSLDQMPNDIKERWLSKEGWYRIQIFPKHDLNDLKNLETFITEVQSVAPDTTDLPIMYWESMKAVLGAFEQAITIALIAIAVVLLVIRRNLIDTLLVMTPLVLAGLFTMASAVLTHTPINFANIIALPLLLGFGVDNGIHMVEKLRHSLSEEQNIYQSSTARAMFYGALTTSSSFIGLAFSPHQGVASMGLVITMGIFWIMTCTFVVLPALGKLVLNPDAKIKAEV